MTSAAFATKSYHHVVDTIL